MSIRTERVARLIQREVAQLLQRDFSQQLPSMVTVTGARVTKDLSIAYIYVSIFGASAEKRKVVFRHLEELTPSIRGSLGRRIRHQLKSVPELRFFLDDTLEEARKMDDLFDRIRAERDDKAE